jgi:hypothetical protein
MKQQITNNNKMEKVILIIALALSLASCNKEEPCNCGTITSDGIEGSCHWLEVRNECSGNKKKFCFDYDVWLDGNPGESFCVTNQPEW